MKYWAKNMAAAALAVAVIGAGTAAIHPAHAGAIEDRQAEMKKMMRANKALQRAARKGQVRTARRYAWTIIASADRLGGLFPRGSDYRGLGLRTTRAKPNIWKHWTSSTRRLNGTKQVARKVAKGNLAAARDMGKQCGGCHKHYRASKAKRKKRNRKR